MEQSAPIVLRKAIVDQSQRPNLGCTHGLGLKHRFFFLLLCITNTDLASGGSQCAVRSGRSEISY
jgi:hypothetical protein